MNLDYLNLWYQALRSPTGTAFSSFDQTRDKMQLYQARRAANDPDLDGLSIVIPPVPNELWILPNGKKVPQTTPESND